MIDLRVLRASFTTLVVSSFCLSICLSIYVTCSIHAETGPGRIVARSGLFYPIRGWTQKLSIMDFMSAYFIQFFRSKTVIEC